MSNSQPETSSHAPVLSREVADLGPNLSDQLPPASSSQNDESNPTVAELAGELASLRINNQSETGEENIEGPNSLKLEEEIDREVEKELNRAKRLKRQKARRKNRYKKNLKDLTSKLSKLPPRGSKCSKKGTIVFSNVKQRMIVIKTIMDSNYVNLLADFDDVIPKPSHHQQPELGQEVFVDECLGHVKKVRGPQKNNPEVKLTKKHVHP